MREPLLDHLQDIQTKQNAKLANDLFVKPSLPAVFRKL